MAKTIINFATNRNPDNRQEPKSFGKTFSSDGLANLRFGEAVFEGENHRHSEIRVESEEITTNKAGDAIDMKNSKLGSLKMFENMRRNMKDGNCDTVIFIHGYNVSFDDGLASAARLKRNFENANGGHEVNMVLFSWPSDGILAPFLPYASDRGDAAASGPAFARGFLKLAEFLDSISKEDRCDRKIHLVAHSMGNYVLRNALQQALAQYGARVPRIFDEIMLIAADEDDDAFEHDHKLKRLPRIAKRVSVYFNNNDLILSISDWTKGNMNRLGDSGPRSPRGIPGKVSLIDCTGVVSGLTEHSYFLDEEEVIRDMIQVASGLPSDDFPKDARRYIPESNCYKLLKRRD